jgi:hypothetical protein
VRVLRFFVGCLTKLSSKEAGEDTSSVDRKLTIAYHFPDFEHCFAATNLPSKETDLGLKWFPRFTRQEPGSCSGVDLVDDNR